MSALHNGTSYVPGRSYNNSITCLVEQLDCCNAYTRAIIGANGVLMRRELVSYSTPIAQIVYTDGVCDDTYITVSSSYNCSNSTIRHIGRFLKRYTACTYNDIKSAYKRDADASVMGFTFNGKTFIHYYDIWRDELPDCMWFYRYSYDAIKQVRG